MSNKLFSQLGLGLAALLLAGCTGSTGGGVETRAYVANKERVDQNMQGGNYGYVGGTPKAPDRSNFSKTRQVYTLEFTQNPDVTVDELRKPVPPAAPVSINVPDRVSQSEPESAPRESYSSEAAAPEGSKEYVVQKGDTLQKISMKFYDTHNKWNRIYEANKDILPNPNRIKPGVTIRIP